MFAGIEVSEPEIIPDGLMETVDDDFTFASSKTKKTRTQRVDQKIVEIDWPAMNAHVERQLAAEKLRQEQLLPMLPF